MVNVRIISATNKDLLGTCSRRRRSARTSTGGSRAPRCACPPLRERAADLPLLAKHFLNQCAHLCPDGRPKLLSEAAVEALAEHRWPGNLRELKHEMQRATVLAGDRREIQPEDLSFTGTERPGPPATGVLTLAQKVEALERKEIEEALRRFNQNRTHAAQALGLSRQGLLKKLERFGLT